MWMNCLNEHQKHPAPLCQFQCLFWRERNSSADTVSFMFIEWLIWCHIYNELFMSLLILPERLCILRDRASVLFTSALISNHTLNSYLYLRTVSDQKRLWRFDLLMMLVTNMYEIYLMCKSLRTWINKHRPFPQEVLVSSEKRKGTYG